MKQIHSDQISLFDSMWKILKMEEKELQEHLNISRNLACSKWDRVIIPSISGGYSGISPVIINPEMTKLLHKNYRLIQLDIENRKSALVKLFIPVFKRAKRQFCEDARCYINSGT